MSDFHDRLTNLVNQSSKGDSRALDALCRELEPHLMRMVRRAIHTGRGSSAFERKIMQVVSLLTPPDRQAGGVGSDHLAATVAKCLARSMARRILGLNRCGKDTLPS